MVNFGLYVIFIVYHHFPETPPPRYTGNICLVIRGVPKICCKWKPSIDSISSRNFVSNIRSTHWVILRSIIEFQFVLLPCWFALDACLKLRHFDLDLIWLQKYRNWNCPANIVLEIVDKRFFKSQKATEMKIWKTEIIYFAASIQAEFDTCRGRSCIALPDIYDSL